MIRYAGAGFAALVALSGCTVPAPKPPLVETVAVLPFDSESNDVNAPEIMQKLVYLALLNTPYKVMDVSAVNDTLSKVGIVDGGQLAAVDPVKLGKDLGVQALIFGNVESFSYTNIGFYLQRKVTLELRMVDVATGQTLWENTGTSARRAVAFNAEDAQRNLVAGLADQLVDKLFRTPLEQEAREATVKTLAKLPGYTFSGFPSDEEARKQAGIKELIKTRLKKN